MFASSEKSLRDQDVREEAPIYFCCWEGIREGFMEEDIFELHLPKRGDF